MNEKEELLEQIEKLMSYGDDKPAINPEFLEYFEIDELIGIRDNLSKKVATLSEDDLEWLEQFKKYE